MSAEKIHFVTGRLAEKALRQQVDELSEELGFRATVQVLPISVAALMTPPWIAKHLVIPKENEKNYRELSSVVRKRLTVHLVETMDEVLDLALVTDSA